MQCFFFAWMMLAVMMPVFSDASTVQAAHGTYEINGTTVSVHPAAGYDLCTLSYKSAGKTVYSDCDTWKKTAEGYSIPIPSGVQKSLQLTFYNTKVWDGALDVSWYRTDSSEFHLNNPAQLAGLAAIVNGIYNDEITRARIKGNPDVIVDHVDTVKASGNYGLNRATETFHYGADNFIGKTVYLDCDLDMGGVLNGGNWSGQHNYMPVGGQYLMKLNDSSTKLGSSFNGTLDGQGYTVKNIYCNRCNAGTNYGDGASIGLVGRLGVHDNDPESARAYQPTVKNIITTGYISGRRSVGGIVGKIGKSKVNNAKPEGFGVLIENCANYCVVISTDAKGSAGICGSAWNGGIIRNCFNAGSIRAGYAGPCGGIVGYNEVNIYNCYNIGHITNTASARYSQGIGSHNGGSYTVSNCYWLTGTAENGGYFNLPESCSNGVAELNNAGMKSAAFAEKLNAGGNAFITDSTGLNNGYPVLRCMLHKVSAAQSVSIDVSGFVSNYVVGAKLDPAGLVLWANMSDGSKEQVRCYRISMDGENCDVDDTYLSNPLILKKTGTMTVSGVYCGCSFSQKIPITVETNVTPDRLAVSALSRRTYAAGEIPDFSGVEVIVSYHSASGKYASREVSSYTVTADLQNADGSLRTGASFLTFCYVLNGKKVETKEKIRVLSSCPKVTEGTCVIRSTEDFLWFSALVNEQGYYTMNGELLADISFQSTALVPVGCSSKNAYAGSFSGNGHTVTLGTFQTAALEKKNSELALFGYTKNAEISNLNIAGTVSGEGATAGLIAQDCGYTKVQNCCNRATLNGKNGYAGGMTAYVSGAESSYISCKNIGIIRVSGTTGSTGGTGGILGCAAGAVTVSSCTNAAALSAASAPLGGIVGKIADCSAELKSCTNECALTNGAKNLSSDTGGILGLVTGEHAVQLNFCNNHGNVSSGGSNVGGIVGGSMVYSKLMLYCCMSDGNISGSYGVGGLVGNNVDTVKGCCTFGTIKASNSGTANQNTGVGGLVGFSGCAAGMDACYSACTVSGAGHSGALVGFASNYITASDMYYPEGGLPAANAANHAYIASLAHGAVSAETMKTDAFTALLNKNDVLFSGQNGQYPLPDASLAESMIETKVTIPVGQTVSVLQVTTDSKKTVYLPGETFDSDGMAVTLTLSGGETHTVSGSACTITPQVLTAGTKWVTVSYCGKTATQDVEVLSCGALGRSGNAYVVGSDAQYRLFAAYVNERGEYAADMILTANVNASVALGTAQHPYTGTIRGGGHKVTLKGSGGLISYAGKGAAVEQLTTEGSVSGKSAAGALIDMGTGVTLKECINRASVSGKGAAGGFAGSLSESKLINCTNAGSVSAGGGSSGGLIGIARNVTLTGCSSSVSAAGNSGSGLIGSGSAAASG